MAVGFLHERMAGYKVFQNTGYKLAKYLRFSKAVSMTENERDTLWP
jgi:hypothetical protein